ncbi:MAG: LLM class flavin-dependent oxidoreductase [Candidatus Lokiarchaeota archaeon]|nr:LLM class flavin-dependent oxidoreductase [Candidatus Lokiarchaeota archaeon]
MKFGINTPNFGWSGDVDLFVGLACDAEDAGWDGFFLWDHLLVFENDMHVPFVDPWITLTAIACSTEKIWLGPLITPLPRRRPWKVARESATLDHLSKGRLILGVGIGAPPEVEYGKFGEEIDAKVRAEKLDECLDIITGLWTGKPFSYSGIHYQLDEMTFLPMPYQKSGIPIWVGGSWPYKAPFRRAAHYSGVAPVHSKWPETLKLEYLRDCLDVVKAERKHLKDFDIIAFGETSGTDIDADRKKLDEWKKMGTTWWIEDIHGYRAELSDLRERIRLGPPKL